MSPRRPARARPPLIARPGAASGQGQEQPLKLLLQAGLTAGREALPHAAGDDLEARPVERARHRGQLGDHLGAVAPGFHHGDDPGELALGPAQAVEHGRGGLVIDPHRVSFWLPRDYTHGGMTRRARPGAQLPVLPWTPVLARTALLARTSVLSRSTVLARTTVGARTTRPGPA